MKLPTKKTPSSRRDPSTMVIYGPPKTGKTTALSGLDDCLILDLQRGSDFVEALKIDILQEAEDNKVLPIIALKKVISAIKENNKEIGGYTYKRIAVDTVSDLEEMIMPLAAQLYRRSSVGKNWTGSDVLDLPRGAGYMYIRTAFLMIVSELKEICHTLILSGHVKNSSINIDGEEITERDLKLTGLLSSIVCSEVDAVGYVYRKENETLIRFKSSENLVSESRSEHLRGRIIPVITSDEDNILNIDWSEILID